MACFLTKRLKILDFTLKDRVWLAKRPLLHVEDPIRLAKRPLRHVEEQVQLAKRPLRHAKVGIRLAKRPLLHVEEGIQLADFLNFAKKPAILTVNFFSKNEEPSKAPSETGELENKLFQRNQGAFC